MQNSTLDIQEVEKFSAIADEWWSETGKFAPLHKLNPTRIAYILEHSKQHFNKENIEGLNLLDIGCGGGLLCEPMARLGANVSGIDASDKNINVASIHAKKEGLEIDYKCELAENLSTQYDVVLNMEVIEHVADVEAFLTASSNLVRKGGLMFVATLNRTITSYIKAIIGAEYVMRWLPRGTHDWKKFLKPSEIILQLEEHNMQLLSLDGMSYNPFKSSWKLDDNVNTNYIMVLEKI